jgi:hypothetical protein
MISSLLAAIWLTQGIARQLHMDQATPNCRKIGVHAIPNCSTM